MNATASIATDSDIRTALRAVKRAAEQTDQSAWFPVDNSDWEVRATKVYALPGRIVRFAWTIHFEARKRGEQRACTGWETMSQMSRHMRWSDRARAQGKVIAFVFGQGYRMVDA